MDYSHKKPEKLINLLDTISQEDLLILGTSLNYNLIENLTPKIINEVIWGDWTNVLIVSESIIDILFIIDELKLYYKDTQWRYEVNYDPNDRHFIDETIKVSFMKIDQKNILKVNLIENFYDVIILDKVDHKISLEAFSALMFASKKIIVNTIDTPNSILYKKDLYDFFHKIDDGCEETNIFDEYEYRQVLGSFAGFKN